MESGTDQVATLADQLRLLAAHRPGLAQQLLADLVRAVDRSTDGALSERLGSEALRDLGLSTT